jgi:DNA polymerase III alpha subunit
MHPCGVTLSNAALLDRLPVQPAPGSDYPMLQADKEDVDSLGAKLLPWSQSHVDAAQRLDG